MTLQNQRVCWLLLVVGIAVRCVAINHPLVNAHAIRQCQTAAVTESLMHQRGFALSSTVPWSGDIDLRYVLELPLYNYLVIGVHQLITNLDESGKITSILLWAASFVLLQFIWRHVLDPEQTNWANLLFVFAPLGVFYGQAFMPEMLVQLLAFAFLLLVIRYDEAPTLPRWISCATIGLIGLLIKLPEISPLYLILAVLIFTREKFKALWRPRYLIAAALTIIAIKAWGNYMDSVNTGPLSFGSSKDNLRVFIGTWSTRFHFVPWAMVCLYLAAFVIPGPAILIIASGFWIFLRSQREKILLLWLASLAAFYLLWLGNTAANQSYYNLVALAPLCALFGIGMKQLLALEFILPWRRVAIIGVLLLVILPAIPVCRYLFKPDQSIVAATQWVRTNTQPNDLILFRPNHRSDMIGYQFNPIMTYYGQRSTFVWTTNTPEVVRKAALERATYAVVTLPKPPATGFLGIINRFRHFNRSPDSTEWLETNGFRIIVRQTDFIVYLRDKRISG